MAQKQETAAGSGEQELIYHQQTQTPKDIADRLREIAGMIENGEVRLGEETFDVPENLFFKTELEEEHNGDIAPINFEIEIEIVFPVVLTADQ
ncbi:hypothetical protein BH20ACI1_BH20ACI1_22040 [soil metagenome]